MAILAPHGMVHPMTRLALLALLALAACAPSSPEPGTNVRHYASTQAYGSARWHVFVFDPAGERDLDTRIALARAAIADEPACAWVDATRAEIEEASARQQAPGIRGQLLAAPLDCT